MKNGTLYREVAKSYDVCFTKDAGFAHNVRQMTAPIGVKVLRVVLPEQTERRNLTAGLGADNIFP